MPRIFRKVEYSKNISDDYDFNGFVVTNNISTVLDKSCITMYDIETSTEVITKENTTYYLTSSEAKWIKNSLFNKEIEYKLNNNAHRCDDFKQILQGENSILFAGCSTTFGQGIPLEMSWPKILFNKLQPIINAKDFYSISFPGGSSFKIISNIFKFCDVYGIPKYIFVLLPDYMRQDKYNYINHDSSSSNSPKHSSEAKEIMDKKNIHSTNSQLLKDRIDSGSSDEEGFYVMYTMMNILKTFCKTNGIKLYMSSWDWMSNKRFLQLNIDRYYGSKYDEAQPYYDDMLRNSDIMKEKYLDMARDGMHPGKLVHSYTADTFFNYFMEELS